MRVVVAVSIPRVGERREWRHEGSGEAAYRGKVAVIIDEGSGSASEVFAAAARPRPRRDLPLIVVCSATRRAPFLGHT